MTSLVTRSNSTFDLLKDYIDTWIILSAVSTDVYNTVYHKFRFLKKLVDTFPSDGKESDLKVITQNYLNAKKIIKDLEEHISYGLVTLYEYPV